MAKHGLPNSVGCVDAVLRLLGVFHDVLYGDVAPVRPGATLGVVSVRLSRSLFVPGRHLEKGGRLPPPLLLAPTPGWPPRGGLVSAPQLPTPGWPLRERRETPRRQCVIFFIFFLIIIFFYFFLFFFLFFFIFLIIFFYYFFLLFFLIFFFFGGGEGGKGSVGLGVGIFGGGGVLGLGLGRGGGSRSVGIFGGGVIGSGFG